MTAEPVAEPAATPGSRCGSTSRRRSPRWPRRGRPARTRAWVALPPGAGKTLVGLMTVRDRVAAGAVGKAVVLGPEHRHPGPVGRPGRARSASTSAPTGRWRTTVTALTYQALAVFDPDDEVDDDGQASPVVEELRSSCSRPR